LKKIKTDPNINVVNLDHLFTNFNTKLSYSDYQAVAEEFLSTHIEEEPINVVTAFGFQEKTLRDCLNRGDLNHATACYYLVANR
jgi:hypothetical protein